jgi:hypothetical protein
MTTDCPREADVLEAVTSRCWPEGLRAHAGACAICGDLATIAAALQDDRDAAFEEAHVPTSGQAWWRATVRMRAEAAMAAARPLTMVAALAGACAAGICAAAITLAWPSGREPLASIGPALARQAQGLGAAAASSGALPALVLAVVLAACLLVAPVVLSLLLPDD